jgi:hypothetical protein
LVVVAGRFLRIIGVVAVLALAGASCAVTPGPGPVVVGTPPAAGPGCSLASRPFQQTSPGPCAASTWRFVALPDGTWQATETGCAGATGIARYDGMTVVLDLQYAGGSGRYTWPLDGWCRGAPGTVTWTTGPLTGQLVASTLAPAN